MSGKRLARPTQELLLARVLAGNFADVLDFFGAVGGAVGAEDVMEPHGGFFGVALLPGVPGVDRLRLAGDESPAVGGDLLFFQVGEVGIEGAAVRSSHVLGAEDGAFVTA